MCRIHKTAQRPTPFYRVRALLSVARFRRALSIIHQRAVQAAAYATCRRTATLLRVAFEYGQT